MNVEQMAVKLANNYRKFDWIVLIIAAFAFSAIGTSLLVGLPGIFVAMPRQLLEQAFGIQQKNGEDAWGYYLLISTIWPFAVVAAYLAVYKIGKRLAKLQKFGLFMVTCFALSFVVADDHLLDAVWGQWVNYTAAREYDYIAQHGKFVRREKDWSVYSGLNNVTYDITDAQLTPALKAMQVAGKK